MVEEAKVKIAHAPVTDANSKCGNSGSDKSEPGNNENK